MRKITILLVTLSLFAASCNTQTSNNNATPTPSPTSSEQSYDNAFMTLALADGWNAKAVANSSAVNITKDNFILYINPQASQASGVEGGRFAEIAQGAPSADTVVKVQPSEPCGTTQQTAVNTSLIREDLFVNPQNKSDNCVVPASKTVWYFSYVRLASKPGYFNYYTSDQTKAYVITMSYNGHDVNTFPEKGSEMLNAALRDMTNMVQSLQLTQK